MRHQPMIPSSKFIPAAILKRGVDACSRTKDNICQSSESLGFSDKSVFKSLTSSNWVQSRLQEMLHFTITEL